MTRPSSDPGRPVVLRAKEANTLRRVTALLKEKRYLKDAETVQAIVQSWDGADGYVVIHRDALKIDTAFNTAKVA